MKKAAAPSFAPKLSLAEIRDGLFAQDLPHEERKAHYQNLPEMFVAFARDQGVDLTQPSPRMRVFLETVLDALEGKDLALLGGKLEYADMFQLFGSIRLGIFACRAAVRQQQAKPDGEAYKALAQRAFDLARDVSERIVYDEQESAGVVGNLAIVSFDGYVNLHAFKFGARYFSDNFVDYANELADVSPVSFAQTLAMLTEAADDQGMALLQQTFAGAFSSREKPAAEDFEANALALRNPYLAPIAELNLQRLFDVAASAYDGDAEVKKDYDQRLALWRGKAGYAQAVAIAEGALDMRFDPPATRPSVPAYVRQAHGVDAHDAYTLH